MRQKVYTVLFLLLCSILVRIYFIGLPATLFSRHENYPRVEHSDNHPRIELRDNHPRARNDDNQPPRPQKHITINFMGRLGNLMFEYASLYGISRKNNLIPVVPRTLSLLNYFNIGAVKSDQRYSKKYVEKKGCTYEPEAMQLGNGSDVTLEGYFQSWKYFQFVEKEIRQNFRWKESIVKQADDLLGKLVKKQDTILVGVHVRRGDMVHSDIMVNYGYIAANMEYLNKALTYFRSKFKSVSFIVVSDDVKWCEENIKGEDVHILSKPNSPEVDMAILTRCNHTVITSGSFGWWSAWLAGGEVVYFKGYPRPGSNLFKLITAADYRPQSWIGM